MYDDDDQDSDCIQLTDMYFIENFAIIMKNFGREQRMYHRSISSSKFHFWYLWFNIYQKPYVWMHECIICVRHVTRVVSMFAVAIHIRKWRSTKCNPSYFVDPYQILLQKLNIATQRNAKQNKKKKKKTIGIDYTRAFMFDFSSDFHLKLKLISFHSDEEDKPAPSIYKTMNSFPHCI